MFKRLIAWLKKLFGFGSVEIPTPAPIPVPTPVENFESGYIPSEAAEDDAVFKARGKRAITPPSVDLRSKLGPVDQQGNTNACVSHAVTTALEGSLGVLNQSRNFVYWNARALAGTTARDGGCSPRNAMRGIQTYGCPEESVWPYSTSTILTKPSAAAFAAAGAIRSKIKSYQAITSLLSMKQALAQGLPVVFGMQIPDTFVSVTKYTGEQPMWTSTTKWLGGHAMVAVGYDDAKGAMLVRNSFGPLWGNQGHCWIPYGWFTFASGTKITDLWAIIPA